MKKDFYIFRHGETELNRQKRWQGSGMDYDLNETGMRQAQQLAEKLTGKGLEIIYSSPLLRAKHTAEAVADKLNIPVIVEPDLRECFYGAAEGQLISDLQNSMPEIVNNWSNPHFMNLRFPQGEAKNEALKRVWNVLESLCNTSYSAIGIAIHGGTMAAMLNSLNFDFEKLPNCAAFRLSYDNGHWQVCGNIF